MKNAQDIISGIIKAEGSKYTNHPSDKGGPTKYGITLKTLSEHRGKPCTAEDVEKLTEAEAREIYLLRYIFTPKFDQVEKIAPAVGIELIDTGVNMGPEVASLFLQRILTAFNKQGVLYPDLKPDGRIGKATLDALQAFKINRGEEGIIVLLKALNCLQGERYIVLAEKREKNEDFVYGWIKERVEING